MAYGSRFYKSVYNKDYFTGRTSFFYKLGYRNSPKVNKKRMMAVLRYKTGGKLLDVGCAFGFAMEEFKRRFTVFGIDVSEYAIRHAPHDVPRKNIFIHDVEKSFPFPENYFDVITCFDVLEHVRRPDVVAKNMYRQLKKGGILFISTPNKNILRKIFYRWADKMEHHISMMTRKQLEKMLIDNGFSIEFSMTALNLGIQQLWLDSRFGLESIVVCRKM